MQVYYIKNYPGLKPTEYIRLLLIKTGWESGGKNEVKDKEAFNSFSKGKLQQLIRWNETQIIREMQSKAMLPKRAVGKLEPPWSWGEQVDTAVSRCGKIPLGNETLSAPRSWFYTPRETQTGPQGLINHRVFCGSREWGQLRYPEERGSVKSGDHTQQNTVELSEEIIQKSLQQPTSLLCFDISSDHLIPANTVFHCWPKIVIYSMCSAHS